MVLASLDSLKWSLPAVLAAMIYRTFRITDDNSSDAVRHTLSTFLMNQKYEPYLGVLPDLIHKAFAEFFGDHQASWKCLARSSILTASAIALSCIFSLLYNAHDFIGVFTGYSSFMETLHRTLVKDPKAYGAALFVAALEKEESFVWVLPVLWVGWCLVPDYISVLKARILLLVLKNTPMGVSALIMTIIIDFFISTLLFLASFTLFQLVVIEGFAIHLGLHPKILDFNASVTLFGILYAFEGTILLTSGMVFFTIPIGNLFWASMLPSVWLWVYVASALVARWLLASRRTFRTVIWLLDFTVHPIRALGALSAGVTFVVTLSVLIGFWLLRAK